MKNEMKTEESKRLTITVNEDHKRAFENLNRNIVNGLVKCFGTNKGFNSIFIEPNRNIGYTNTFHVKKVDFTENMEIEHLVFDGNNSHHNKMFEEIIVPLYFYRDTYRIDLSYRITFKVIKSNILLTVTFNKNNEIINIEATQQGNGVYEHIDVAIEGFRLADITIKEEKKTGIFSRIFGL